MFYLTLSASFEYLCYGAAIINILHLTFIDVRKPTALKGLIG